jgi:YVTN family beta-propeller protein
MQKRLTNPRALRLLLPFSIALCLPLWFALGQNQQTPPQPPAGAQDAQGAPPAPKKGGGGRRPGPPGVSTPGVKRDMSALTPDAVFPTEGTPDWQVLTDDAVWVSNRPLNTVHRLDPKTNRILATVPVGKSPCSGLAAGFGSIWVPNCGDRTGDGKSVSRIDVKTNEVVATLPIGPAQSEGGVATGAGSFWMVSDQKGVLSRIDPATNKVVAEITVPEKSAACNFGEDAVWITTPATNQLTRVDPKTNKVTDTIEVGKGPRFLTVGAGSVWTLNQGDGTISRVDGKTAKVVATIEAGIPGSGGEIAFGEGHVWATIPQIPITEIDPATNAVIKQWVGPGGDSIRAGHGSVWLSNLSMHNVWRLNATQQ